MAKTIKNILVPVIFLSPSEQTLEIGIAMCKRHGASLHLLKINRNNGFVYPSGKRAMLIRIRLESIMEEMRSMELYAKKISRKYGIACYYHIKEGTFSDVVCDTAKNFYCDLIILEKPVVFPFFNYFNNTGASQVIKGTPCPVMTIPKDSRIKDFKSILIPVWPTENILEDVEVSLPIIKKNHSTVLLLGSINTLNHQWELNMVKNLMVSLGSIINMTNNKVLKEIDQNPATATKTLKKAAENQSDLIVISVSRKQNLKSFFGQSYSESIIKNSTVPVLSI